ncbi:hypothetical protein HYW59_02600 [Candidatus Kaiserbacteria bacterium]|nr:hypothetical protein [Candidatus Kaiserbacteria bacterium]
MAKLRKTVAIPSIRVDRDFLQKLGRILEKEARNRVAASEKIVSETIKEKEREIRSRAFFNDDDAVRQMAESERRFGRPPIAISYTINTSVERLSFSTMKELLDTDLPPKRIESIGARVSHYGTDDYVDIDISISQPFAILFWGNPETYDLSSSNHASLLEIDRNLQSLFAGNRSGYHQFLYPITRLPYLVPFIVSIILAFASARTLLQILPLPQNESGATLIIYFFMIMYLLSSWALKWLYPYFEFVIGLDQDIRLGLRKLFGVIAISIVANATYDFLKNF